MQSQKLDQFLVDYYQETDEITVNCRWLQEQLMSKESISRHRDLLLGIIERLEDRNMTLEIAISIYKDRVKSMRRLDITY